MYNKRKHIYHSKGKNQVLSRLMHGEFLGNLFALTVNGEEVYYKGSWPSISADYDQIIYIPGEQQYMSACYTIELNMKFKSPESMSDAVRSLQEYIKKDAETDYDLESYAADGIGTENIDDLMKIFLSDRKRQRITITDSGEWKNYSADFNASYGWESVLVKMFKILGVYLANGSQLDISIDNDYNGLVIRNGICKQINLKGEEEKSL